MTAAEAVLRRLSTSDETSLRPILAPVPEFRGEPSGIDALDRRVRVLVRLAALFALDAPTPTLRWAVELAWNVGVPDDDLVATLLAAGSAAGQARLAASAPSLALALGYR